MKWQHGLASHGSFLQAGKVARMSSRRSSAAARQSVKRDNLPSCTLTYSCQLSARRHLFQLCVFCLRNTQMLYLAPIIWAVTEERRNASYQSLLQAFDVVAVNVATLLAAWCASIFPGAKFVGRFAGCQCILFLWDALYHACAQVCS